MVVLVNADTLLRVIRINYGSAVGTAFVLGAGNELRVIVTAGHLLKGAAVGDKLALRHKEDWAKITIAHIEHAPCGSDVCAVIATTQWGEGLPYDILNPELLFGDEVAFLGFPLGLEMKGMVEPAYPSALIKAGIFSGEIQADGILLCLFDAINNVGFSGGPIITFNRTLKANRIAGVVSGYKHDSPTPVLFKDENGVEKPSGDYYVRANSGFMYGIGADIVRSLVQSATKNALAAKDSNGLAIVKADNQKPNV